VGGRFVEQRVPGDHTTLFAPEHAATLAAVVAAALDRAEG
jgi:thioesterase domain-containing protein